jgi:hypothetical protein
MGAEDVATRVPGFPWLAKKQEAPLDTGHPRLTRSAQTLWRLKSMAFPTQRYPFRWNKIRRELLVYKHVEDGIDIEVIVRTSDIIPGETVVELLKTALALAQSGTPLGSEI